MILGNRIRVSVSPWGFKISTRLKFLGLSPVLMTKGAAATRSGLGGMTDLLRRLEELEIDCLGKSEGKAESLDSKDRFLSLKANMNRDLGEIRGKINERRVCTYPLRVPLCTRI